MLATYFFYIIFGGALLISVVRAITRIRSILPGRRQSTYSGPTIPTFSLAELQGLLADGKITAAEFEKLRDAVQGEYAAARGSGKLAPRGRGFDVLPLPPSDDPRQS